LECRHLRNRVGIRARVLHHRGVLALEAPGRVEECTGAESDDPAHAQCLGRVEDVLGALDVDRLEVRQVLAGPAQERGTMNRRISAGGGATDIIGIGDVASAYLDPQGDKWLHVGRWASQGTHGVAALDQEFADVGAGQSGGTGDENRLTHADTCPETSE